LEKARAAMATESPKERIEAQIADPGAPIDRARRSLDDGEKAMEALAYPAAAGYFRAGLKALGEANAPPLEDLSLALTRGLAEAAYLAGDHEAAESLFHDILARARSKLERASMIDRMIVLYATRGDFAGAIRVGKVGLALFGVSLPETAEQQQAALGAL